MTENADEGRRYGVLARMCRCPVLVTPSGRRCMFFRFHKGDHRWNEAGSSCLIGRRGSHGYPDEALAHIGSSGMK